MTDAPAPAASRWSVAPGVLHRVVGDEVFVLMPDSRVHWLKRPSALLIWQAITNTPDVDVETLVTLLVKRFDAAPSEILADTIDFLKDLEARGAIVARP